MADVELVIKIPEETYIGVLEEAEKESKIHSIIYDAIASGKSLPKGHGDLIDKDVLLDGLEKTVESVDDTNKHLLSWDRAVAHVHLSKPIIEADKESKDG